MTHLYIEALGYLLATYRTDLEYIDNFQKFKKGKIDIETYLSMNKGFSDFLNEFRIARNINKGQKKDLLIITMKWLKNKDVNKPDLFVDFLIEEKITENRIASLASKVLFLNNPAENFPMDGLTRNTLEIRENLYENYILELEIFKNGNIEKINKKIKVIEGLLIKIEKKFTEIENIEKIRINRYIDKILWISGKK